MKLRREWILILIVVLGIVGLWATQNREPEVLSESQETIGKPVLSSPLDRGGGRSSLLALNKEKTPSVEKDVLVITQLARSFSVHLDELAACWGVGVQSGEQTPSAENLLAAVRSSLGEPTNQVEDWSNIHLKLANGEERRLRLEHEASGETSTELVLKIYSVDSEGLPVPIPLAREKSLNPSPAFLASLESEGSVILRESGMRLFFADGSDVYLIQRNGLLTEVEMFHEGRTFRCQNLNEISSQCSCLR